MTGVCNVANVLLGQPEAVTAEDPEAVIEEADPTVDEDVIEILRIINMKEV